MKWLIVLSVCVASAVASDWEILPKCDGKDWQYFVDPQSNCRSYFRCENGRPVRHNCDHGLLFDTNTLSCNWEQSVHCAHVPNYPSIPEPPMNQPGQPGHQPSPAGFCPPNENPQTPTHLADTSDCTKFFKCLNGRPIPQNCPTGTHWNDNMKYCDYPSNAQCWKRIKTIR
ncbi:peritrophin-1-like [Phlebotomus argentipes]|uniref:peritrophin-1-like n=1 Tax=Phlebotomus argentipes TaxID=94469 RepID=UPI002892C381|nr:peritrophin-1-like [Phlebotomus argentipes]